MADNLLIRATPTSQRLRPPDEISASGACQSRQCLTGWLASLITCNENKKKTQDENAGWHKSLFKVAASGFISLFFGDARATSGSRMGGVAACQMQMECGGANGGSAPLSSCIDD